MKGIKSLLIELNELINWTPNGICIEMRMLQEINFNYIEKLQIETILVSKENI